MARLLGYGLRLHSWVSTATTWMVYTYMVVHGLALANGLAPTPSAMTTTTWMGFEGASGLVSACSKVIGPGAMVCAYGLGLSKSALALLSSVLIGSREAVYCDYRPPRSPAGQHRVTTQLPGEPFARSQEWATAIEDQGLVVGLVLKPFSMQA